MFSGWLNLATIKNIQRKKKSQNKIPNFIRYNYVYYGCIARKEQIHKTNHTIALNFYFSERIKKANEEWRLNRLQSHTKCKPYKKLLNILNYYCLASNQHIICCHHVFYVQKRKNIRKIGKKRRAERK